MVKNCNESHYFVPKTQFVKSLLFLPNLGLTRMGGSRWCRNDQEASFEIKEGGEGFESRLNGNTDLN